MLENKLGWFGLDSPGPECGPVVCVKTLMNIRI